MTGPFAQIGAPVLIDERGYVWLPSRDPHEPAGGWYLRAGLSVAWAPLPGNTGALLHMLAGIAPVSGYEDDGLAVTLTREGLRQLIADLQSIDAQLAGAAA